MILIRRIYFIIPALFLFYGSLAQNFASPVSWPIKLSGTFGELRPGHFHMGIDIKSPNGAVGHPILSIDDGYISRIQVSSGGYGKVLHIIHPSGHESVYAHLNSFTPEVDAYVKTQQYQKESFEVDLMLFPDQFVVARGEQIGILGMTGRTFGPHLHFELRDKWTGVGLNPLNFGIPVADTESPRIYQVVIYELDNQYRTLNKRKIDPEKLSETITVRSSHVGVGIKSYDRMNGVRNLNGIHCLELLVDNNSVYRFDFDTLSYSQQRFINAHKDYKSYVDDAAYVNRMYRFPGNDLDIYQHKNNGIIELSNGTSKAIEINVSDSFGNERKLNFRLKKEGDDLDIPGTIFNYEIKQDQPTTIHNGEWRLDFPKEATYRDVFARIQSRYDEKNQKIYHIHDRSEPIHHPYMLSIYLPSISDSLKTKYFVAGINSRGDQANFGGSWKGDTLLTRLYGFGDYTVSIDTIPPTVEPKSFRPNDKTAKVMSFTIKDQFSRASLKYKAMVDGKWILMEYDAKRDRLTHYFDGSIGPGSHLLVIELQDRNGNTSSESFTFQR